MKPRGRRSKLNANTHAAVVKALASGCYRETAAQIAGVGVSTLYRWLEQGDDDIKHDRRSPHRELREAIENAEAKSEQDLLGLIRQAAPQNWQAAAWMLERKNPARWGRRDAHRVEVSGPDGRAIELAAPADSVDRSTRAAQLLAQAGALPELNGHGNGNGANGHH